MATKKVPARGANRNAKNVGKKAAPRKKSVGTKKPILKRNIPVRTSLDQTAKQAQVAERRAGLAYVEKAAELEAARLAQREAARQIGVFYAAEAARAYMRGVAALGHFLVPRNTPDSVCRSESSRAAVNLIVL